MNAWLVFNLYQIHGIFKINKYKKHDIYNHHSQNTQWHQLFSKFKLFRDRFDYIFYIVNNYYTWLKNNPLNRTRGYTVIWTLISFSGVKFQDETQSWTVKSTQFGQTGRKSLVGLEQVAMADMWSDFFSLGRMMLSSSTFSNDKLEKPDTWKSSIIAL